MSDKRGANSKGILACRRENFLGRAEPVCSRYPDGEPDKVKEEIKKTKHGGELEYHRIQFRGKVVHDKGQQQKTLGHGPHESAPFDVTIACPPPREFDVPYGKERDNIVGGDLCPGPGG